MTEVFRIRGGHRLEGTIESPGSKNAALAILSAIPVVHGKVVLTNLPKISDVRIKMRLLEQFGITIEEDGKDTIFDTTNLRWAVPSESMVRPIRTGFYLFGPLLGRFGRAVLPMPGGCNIGARPVDFHLKGLRVMGADVSTVGGLYKGSVSKLHGGEIYLDFPSAGATQHLMTTACLATGLTVIRNAAMEPEVVQLADFLTSMGAKIDGAGTSTVTIIGRGVLGGGCHRVPSDRIQAGTYLIAGAITGGRVKVTGILPEHQKALLEKLSEAGISVEEDSESATVLPSPRPRGVKVKTMPYPGFPTDVQQMFTSLMTLAEGQTIIEETLYEARTGHVRELARMGADIDARGHLVMIQGVPQLRGAHVVATDLRAGAALVLAGLAAEGTTVVDNINFIDRGYENFAETLRSLGADIERVLAPDQLSYAQ
jgi:UDP-N-acetylglucosamine 1-carboxyvinyltransferase